MRTLLLLFVLTAFVAPCAYGRAAEPAGGAKQAQSKSLNKSPRKRLRAFRSERELRRFLRKLAGVETRREMAMSKPSPVAPPVAPVAKAATATDSAPATPSAGAAARSPVPAESADESVKSRPPSSSCATIRST